MHEVWAARPTKPREKYNQHRHRPFSLVVPDEVGETHHEILVACRGYNHRTLVCNSPPRRGGRLVFNWRTVPIFRSRRDPPPTETPT
jgi:hypothetical protein